MFWGRSGCARVNDARRRPCQLLCHQLNWRQRGTCTEGSKSFTQEFSSTAHHLPSGLPAFLLPQRVLGAFQEGHRTAFWDDFTCLSVLQGENKVPLLPKIAPLPQFCSKNHLVLSLSHYLEPARAPCLSGYFTVSLPALAKPV